MHSPARPDRVDVPAEELIERCQRLLDNGGRMQLAYAWFPSRSGAEVRYLCAPAVDRALETWVCPVGDTPLPSLARLSPLMGWYEREITDLCGPVFDGHPGPDRLVLQDSAHFPAPPLSPAFVPGDARNTPDDTIRSPEILGDDVQTLPFGPVRAGVVESAQFFFFYLGEHILHYQPRLFLKHRGMEKRFQGLDPNLAVLMAERVSGVGSFAHGLAYCQAVEAAADCQPPDRALWLRVILAELERLYNHLHYFSHLADTTTLKVGHAQGALLQERLKQLNARLTGHRLLRHLLTPGGLRRDLVIDEDFKRALIALRDPINDYLTQLSRTSSYIDRLLDTGPLAYQVAFDQGATGPVERASGLDRDLRRDHPYAAYAECALEIPVRERGDAQGRAEVRAAEIDHAFHLILDSLTRLPEGPVRVPCVPAPGTEGLGWSESPRGSVYYAVHLDEGGRLARVKVKSPSFSNWRVFPFTVHGTDMMDYAINEASFGSTIAGCDR